MEFCFSLVQLRRQILLYIVKYFPKFFYKVCSLYRVFSLDSLCDYFFLHHVLFPYTLIIIHMLFWGRSTRSYLCKQLVLLAGILLWVFVRFFILEEHLRACEGRLLWLIHERSASLIKQLDTSKESDLVRLKLSVLRMFLPSKYYIDLLTTVWNFANRLFPYVLL